ncbi:sensor histidine kinase [Streptococcus himalayensis]|uniref:histidine kinase n=1 Tax=Streptococcus himalayensis TaxID=1888195 RepID=A0A917EHI2_9STRE|nr:HAMP domain-containing sensor histidine kinase [Streptococcus himalayensis]GGE35731.1 sensor protein CiaH [Streptococcus himalayensis]
MLNKFKTTWYSDNFSYFLRNFGVFTLIFSAMTLIILQVMRSSLYVSVDNKITELSQKPSSVINMVLRREEVNFAKDLQGYQVDESDLLDVSANTEVILFNKDYEAITTGDNFLGLNNLAFDKRQMNRIRQVQVKNGYGGEETYRMMVFPCQDAKGSLVKYAAIFINTSQLEQANLSHEQVVIMVMVSFWLLSVVASIYLASVSVKPLLESMQKQKSFVENASHELRTPLAVLQNRLETLFRKPEATIMDSSESIASSLEEVRNMRMLTTNLLNLARRDDGITPEIVDVDQNFFNTTFTNYEMIATENGKTFRFQNKIFRTIRTDKTLLKQLMTILFDNAIKYTDEDGEIELTVSANDRTLFLTVEDNGAGIRNEDKKRVFDRFYRIDKARTRQKGGFGLGLSLAKQIVEALKGTITVKDNKPRGTIFEVKIAIKTDNKKKK